MSLLIELIKTIAEAIEEGRGNQRPRQLQPTAPPPATDEVDTVADFEEPEDLKAKQRLQRKQAEVQRARADAGARAMVTARRAASAEIERVVPRQATAGERLGRLLHQPQTLRDLVLLKEILDRPLALRRDRR